MPWKHEWVQPDLAFTVTKFKPSTKTERASLWIYQVFHAYKNDDYNERLSYWYTLHDGDPANHPPEMSDVDHTYFEFDIRDFPTYDHSMEYDDGDHQIVMQQALDAGLCTIDQVMLSIHPLAQDTNAPQ